MLYPTNIEDLSKVEWSKDFLRKVPSAEFIDYDPNYLLNQADALNYFYSWYLSREKIQFIDMLKNQHKFACLGKESNRSYKIKGYFRSKDLGSNTWDERDSFPGKLRIELKQENIPHPSIDMLRIKKDEYYIIKNEKYFDNLYNRKNNRMIFENTGIKSGPYLIECEVEALNAKRVHEFKYYKNGYFKINHPKEKEYKVSQSIVTELMNEIISINSNSPKVSFLELLAMYYHNAIKWMPFAHVNNSLFMGQINVILRQHNFNSVPHSKLDIYALLTSTINFKKIFLDHILSNQK